MADDQISSPANSDNQDNTPCPSSAKDKGLTDTRSGSVGGGEGLEESGAILKDKESGENDNIKSSLESSSIGKISISSDKYWKKPIDDNYFPHVRAMKSRHGARIIIKGKLTLSRLTGTLIPASVF